MYDDGHNVYHPVRCWDPVTLWVCPRHLLDLAQPLGVRTGDHSREHMTQFQGRQEAMDIDGTSF